MLLGEHAVVYGRPCLVTAVDRRICVTVEAVPDGLIHVTAPAMRVDHWAIPSTRIETEDPPAGLRFLLAGVRTVAVRFGIPGGVRIETGGSLSDQLGLGSSAAVTVAMVAALSQLLELELPKEELLALAREAVCEVQGTGSGFDIAAALHGGTLYYRREGPEIALLSSESLPLVVGHTGIKADTVTLVQQVAQKRVENPGLVEEIFDGLARSVETGRRALVARDWARLGWAMSLSQALLETLGVGTPRLAQMVQVALEAGAQGAKLSGAGGGDCMIALVEEQRRDDIVTAIESVGGAVLPVETGARGLRVAADE